MASLKVELIPFVVPSFVSQKMPPCPRQEGFKELPKFSLGDLPDAVLDELCEEFRAGVFARAAEQRGHKGQ